MSIIREITTTQIIGTAVSLLPINFESITIEDTYTADEINENTIAAPSERSVYDKRGLSRKMSAPLEI